MPRVVYRTLDELEAGHANARSAARASQIRTQARELAASLNVAVPSWAVSAAAPLPAELERYLASHPGARLLRMRGGVSIDFGGGVVKHYPSLSAAAASVA